MPGLDGGQVGGVGTRLGDSQEVCEVKTAVCWLGCGSPLGRAERRGKIGRHWFKDPPPPPQDSPSEAWGRSPG